MKAKPPEWMEEYRRKIPKAMKFVNLGKDFIPSWLDMGFTHYQIMHAFDTFCKDVGPVSRSAKEVSVDILKDCITSLLVPESSTADMELQRQPERERDFPAAADFLGGENSRNLKHELGGSSSAGARETSDALLREEKPGAPVAGCGFALSKADLLHPINLQTAPPETKRLNADVVPCPDPATTTRPNPLTAEWNRAPSRDAPTASPKAEQVPRQQSLTDKLAANLPREVPRIPSTNRDAPSFKERAPGGSSRSGGVLGALSSVSGAAVAGGSNSSASHAGSDRNAIGTADAEDTVMSLHKNRGSHHGNNSLFKPADPLEEGGTEKLTMPAKRPAPSEHTREQSNGVIRMRTLTSLLSQPSPSSTRGPTPTVVSSHDPMMTEDRTEFPVTATPWFDANGVAATQPCSSSRPSPQARPSAGRHGAPAVAPCDRDSASGASKGRFDVAGPQGGWREKGSVSSASVLPGGRDNSSSEGTEPSPWTGAKRALKAGREYAQPLKAAKLKVSVDPVATTGQAGSQRWNAVTAQEGGASSAKVLGDDGEALNRKGKALQTGEGLGGDAVAKAPVANKGGKGKKAASSEGEEKETTDEDMMDGGNLGASSSPQQPLNAFGRPVAPQLPENPGPHCAWYELDITNGRETLKVACVNEYQDKFPPHEKYWAYPKFKYLKHSKPFSGGARIGKEALLGKSDREKLEALEKNQQGVYIDCSIQRTEPAACTCSGNCLSDAAHCKCNGDTYGEHAYDKNGRLLQIVEPERWLKCHEDKKDAFITECFSLCDCNVNTCGNRVVQRGMTFQLQVFMTPEGKGWGIRALELILKGSFVFEYCGEILTNEEQWARNEEYDREKNQRTFQVSLDGDKLVEGRCIEPGAWEGLSDEGLFNMDATRHGNIARFLNHSCTPNLISKNVQIESRDTNYYHLAYFALKDIQRGDELTWNYGSEGKPVDTKIPSFRCLCGEHCQKKKKMI